jgi:hypothetical protein
VVLAAPVKMMVSSIANRAIIILTEPEAHDMANRHQRSNREKKKPKADKNKTKSTAPASPFTLPRSTTPPASGHTAKGTA